MKKILINLLFFLIVFSIFSEDTDVEIYRPYKLIHADKLTATKVDSAYITNLVGSVHFFYGDTEFFSDQAEIFEDKETAKLVGNVIVIDDSLELQSQWVEYDNIMEKLQLNEEVFIVESHQDSTFRTFSSDKAIYTREEKILEAFDNIYTYDSREEIVGKCHYLKYNSTSGYGYLIKDPILTSFKQDSLQIIAQKIEYYKDYEKVVASFDVKTRNSDFSTKSDFLMYFVNDEKAIYLGKPSLNSGFAYSEAEEFYIYMKDNQLSYANLIDSCYVEFTDKENQEKENWVESQLMDFNFKDGKISQCIAETGVISYLKNNKEENDKFKNKTNGDKLILLLNTAQEIESIQFIGSVDGKYKFHNKSIDK